MADATTPNGFLSYVHADDENDSGRIVSIATRLRDEVRAQTALDFDIFIDRKDLHWGTEWKTRLKLAVQRTTLLFPVITPRYFTSEACKEELETFLLHETLLGRNNLILPIQYINPSPVANFKGHTLTTIIAGRQYRDWRALRTAELDSPAIKTEIIAMATEVVLALNRRPKLTQEAADIYLKEVLDLKTLERDAVSHGMWAWNDLAGC